MALLSSTLALVALLTPAAPPAKKLLQWGWDEPDTAYLRAHLAEMEESPFDGCVFGVKYGEGGKGGSFSWQAWGRRRFTEEELAPALEDLRCLRPRRFTELFLRVNVTPGDIGWFQDHSAIVSNARLAARLARAGRARGILLDTEQYQGQLFELRRQPMAETYGWDAYAAQARRRGREVMAAFQDAYPGLTVFLTFGHSLPWAQITAPDASTNSDSPASQDAPLLAKASANPPAGALTSTGVCRSLSTVSYGLLAPFVDGLLEEARGRTVVIDGFELSYGFREPAQFVAARSLVDSQVLPIVGAREAYLRRLQLSFGLWLDYDWRRKGWNPDAVSSNYYTPKGFERALRAALQQSSRYVWVYAENVRWWPTPSADRNTPLSFENVLTLIRSPDTLK